MEVEHLPDGKLKVKLGYQPGHQMRVDFAGWGAVPPLYSNLRQVLGLRPIPGFAGSPKDESRWLEELSHSSVWRHLELSLRAALRSGPTARPP